MFINKSDLNFRFVNLLIGSDFLVGLKFQVC